MTADSSGLLNVSVKEQCIFNVKWYIKNNEGLVARVCSFCIKYGQNGDITSSTVKRLILKI